MVAVIFCRLCPVDPQMDAGLYRRPQIGTLAGGRTRGAYKLLERPRARGPPYHAPVGGR